MLKIGGFLLGLLLLMPKPKAEAYSVLTHQAIIDGAWETAIVPLLEQRYPEITASELRTARSFAYGGSIIQDIGYYPMGSKFFTQLTHYVRTGDFINNLFSEARNADEFAFAIGALSHYYADTHGHATGINLSVPLIYPELENRFGSVISYQQDHKSHTRTEFAFDVIQAARHEYPPEPFRDHIGFQVAEDQLARAFQKTYGLRLKQVFLHLPASVNLFRLSVKSLIPQFNKIAWYQNRNKIGNGSNAALTSRQIARIQSEEINKQFAKDYPGFWAKVMSYLFRVVPRVGPLSALNFKLPNAEAEALFLKSVGETLGLFEEGLWQLRHQQFLAAPAYNLDTGSPTQSQEYGSADETHRELLHDLHKHDFQYASGVLQTYLLAYFANLPPPTGNRKEMKAYRKTQAGLQQLQQQKTGNKN